MLLFGSGFKIEIDEEPITAIAAELADGTRVSPFLLGEDEHVEITEE